MLVTGGDRKSSRQLGDLTPDSLVGAGQIRAATRREAGLKNLFKMISVRRVWFRRQSSAPCAP